MRGTLRLHWHSRKVDSGVWGRQELRTVSNNCCLLVLRRNFKSKKLYQLHTFLYEMISLGLTRTVFQTLLILPIIGWRVRVRVHTLNNNFLPNFAVPCCSALLHFCTRIRIPRNPLPSAALGRSPALVLLFRLHSSVKGFSRFVTRD